MRKYYTAISLCLIFISCSAQNEQNNFNLIGASALTVKNSTNDFIKIEIENWQIIPLQSQEIDTILLANSVLSFEIKTQGFTYFDLRLNGIPHKIFTIPGESNIITFNKESPNPQFSGNLKSINDFTTQKAVHFNSVNADWMTRANATHGSQSFEELILFNDSITELHLNYLQKNGESIPNWFLEFEQKRLNYLNAHMKINSLMYRRRMLNRVEKIPEGFSEKITNGLPIEDVSMLGNMRYTNFLSDYVGNKTDPNYEREQPSSKSEWIDFYDELLNSAAHHLSGDVKNVYLTSLFRKIIGSRRVYFKNEWIEYIDDPILVEYVQKSLAENPILPKGAKVPHFYLPDSAFTYKTPNTFEKQILLINFWATWCKPCIKEFPIENELVEKFEDEPVQIINICMSSEVEKWKEMIHQYELKTTNLFSDGNWNDRLNDQFDINGLPHSILVDWNGNVVQNKCLRASEGIEESIEKLLLEMKLDQER